ncbi:hypothetical protein NGRA_0184 [Nosema granulosis]|uniref:Cullin family profile domain-containing protein n=1 Tax=Nosema granulosis TaxID=83296 RepID=A0A9P6L0D2_9MICR|nr:hypothetical protein NGRA_0184 [Nosema granulosis]
MSECVKLENSILKEFVKSFFKDQKTLPYAFVSQFGQRLVIENDLKHLNRDISNILKKYLRRRFKRYNFHKSGDIKRSKVHPEGLCTVKNIVDEYIWLYRMLNTFKNIFFTSNCFDRFYKMVHNKFNGIVLDCKEHLVDTLSTNIYNFRDFDNESNTSFIDCCERPREGFTDLQYVVLVFKLFKELDSGQEIISCTIKSFIKLWTQNAFIEIKDIAELNRSVECVRKNIVFVDYIHNIEKEIIAQLFSKISTDYILTCIGFKQEIIYLEYYYELIGSNQLYINLINKYIDSRYNNIPLPKNIEEVIEPTQISLLKDKIDEIAKTQTGSLKKIMFAQTSERLCDILNKKSHSIKSPKDDHKFVEIFSFWLETLTCKKTESVLRDALNSGFEKYINKDEFVIINSISEALDRIITGEMDVRDCFGGVLFRELSFMSTLFNKMVLFGGNSIGKGVLCPNLLCGVSIVLEDVSIVENALEGSDLIAFLKRTIYKFVGDVFNIIKDKDAFELSLREKLSLRLFSETSLLQEEEQFISCLRSNISRVVYSKLETILSDYKDRTIFRNAEIMLLRRFQWPDFKYCNVHFGELDDIKKEYSEQLQANERKTLIFMDSLSSCDVEINGRPLKVSLIQFKMIKNLCEIGRIFDDKIQKADKEFYEQHLNELIKKKLLVKNNSSFEINTNVPENDFVPRQINLKGPSGVQPVEDECKYKNALVESRIMRICKARKNIPTGDLCELLEIDRSTLEERIKDLKTKGYLDVSEEIVTYVP